MAVSTAIKEPLFFKAQSVALASAEHSSYRSAPSGRAGAGSEERQTTSAVFDVPGYGPYAVAWPRGQAPSRIEAAASAKPADKPAFVYFAVPANGADDGAGFALSRPLQNALAILAFFSATGFFAEMLARKNLRPEQMPASRYVIAAHAAVFAASALLLLAAPRAA